jgi:undecaprenyl diphosphate synthase
MDLFLRALDKEAGELHENNICLRFIGDITAFKPAIQKKMMKTQKLTAENTGLRVNIAANYGGRWDITQAAVRLAKAIASGALAADNINEHTFAEFLALADSRDPDLFIRTGGELRISNFLLWQSAFTEFYFTQVLWPDFGAAELDEAIATFRSRERRYGQTSEQIRGHGNA